MYESYCASSLGSPAPAVSGIRSTRPSRESRPVHFPRGRQAAKQNRRFVPPYRTEEASLAARDARRSRMATRAARPVMRSFFVLSKAAEKGESDTMPSPCAPGPPMDGWRVGWFVRWPTRFPPRRTAPARLHPGSPLCQSSTRSLPLRPARVPRGAAQRTTQSRSRASTHLVHPCVLRAPNLG